MVTQELIREIFHIEDQVLIQELSTISTAEKFQKGETIYDIGERHTYFCILLSGIVYTWFPDEKQRPNTTCFFSERMNLLNIEGISKKTAVGAKALVTGENLGQVASQTVESITSSNSVAEVLPIFRPLIAMDKEEIIDIAKFIGTYETSILPYEDCCTVFLPKYPLIKPNLKKVLEEESRLDIDGLIERAISNTEEIRI